MRDIFKEVSESKQVDDKYLRAEFENVLRNTTFLSDDTENFVKYDKDLTVDEDNKNILYHELGLKGNYNTIKVNVVADLVYIKDIDYEVKLGGIPKSKSIGFEIKSDKDTLKRLPNQLEVYSKYFIKTYVITTHKHLPKVLQMVKDKKTGVILYNTEDKNRIFKIVKVAEDNVENKEEFGKYWSNLLWLKELEDILKEYKVNYKKNPLLRYKNQKKNKLDSLFIEDREGEEDNREVKIGNLVAYNKTSYYPRLENEIYKLMYLRCENKLNGIQKTSKEWKKDVVKTYDFMSVKTIV